MFGKIRSRWAMKSKNRVGQPRLIAQQNKRSFGQQSKTQHESVASNEETRGDILKQTSYGKLFQATMLVFEDYCENSTLHGVRYFVDKKRHWLERFWWIAGFVMSIFCCVALIHKVYVNWDQRSIIVSISEELTPVWDIPLPAVTICPANKIKIQSQQYNAIEFYKASRKHNISDEEVKMYLAFNIMCSPTQALFDFSDKFIENSVIDTLWELAPSLNYTVQKCYLPGYSPVDNHDFPCELAEIMTEFGHCFTFNMLNGKETYRIESTAYSQMDHNKAAQWNLDNGYDPNLSIKTTAYPYRVSGSVGEIQLGINLHLSREHYIICGEAPFVIALHIPGEIPQRYQFKLQLATFEMAFIMVKPKVIKTSEELRPYHPDRRQCYFNADRKLRFLKLYTQGNCELECLSNFTLSLCGCVPYFLLRDANTPICGPRIYECYDSARQKLVNGQIKRGLNITEEENIRLNKLVENCNCLPPCNSIKYDAEIRRLDISHDTSDIDQLSTLSVEFEESKFMTLTRSEVYGTIDFIANCGGLLGLFLGASFLSVVELLYYCSLRVYCKRLHQKRKHKMAISTVYQGIC